MAAMPTLLLADVFSSSELGKRPIASEGGQIDRLTTNHVIEAQLAYRETCRNASGCHAWP
jgi:hypothetical protein